ncbi:12s seed storage protein crd, partial [Quercus suber]
MVLILDVQYEPNSVSNHCVVSRTGVAGIVLPEPEEKVLAIKKGDAIALPFGVVTWWYNKEDTELILQKLTNLENLLIFSQRVPMGSSQGSLLSLSQAWDLDENAVKGLVGKQSGNGIVQLRGNFKMPEPKKEHREGMALNCEEAPLDMDIKKGGRVVVLNTNNLPLVGEVGLGADLVRLDGSAKCSPGFSCDSALQMTYIIGVVGVFRLLVLMATGSWKQLLMQIAAPDGTEWFSIITTPSKTSFTFLACICFRLFPIFTHLSGRTSVWKALSPQVLQAAFDVDANTEKLFCSRTSD